MKKKITYITGSDYKFSIATEAFKDSDFRLVRKKMETPEVQSTDLGEIAAYSAKWAAAKLKQPIFLTDAGCFIEALNGFPGPFIKFVNQFLIAEDYLRLMKGKRDRKIEFRDCLAYCEPGKKPVLFFSSAEGKMAMHAGKKGETPIDEVFIPKGLNRPASEIPRKEMIKFWVGNVKNYAALLKYLAK